MKTEARVNLQHASDYIAEIVDRIASFDAIVETKDHEFRFAFRFGTAFLTLDDKGMYLHAEADTARDLSRLKEIVAGAVVLYAKVEQPQIVWTGDLSTERELSSFRLMRVIGSTLITPHMRRIRLAGKELERFREMRGMHIRMLFPTPEVPNPVWPIAGNDGLVLWPDPNKKPAARVYTIRKLDVDAGWMDVDFVMHDDGAGNYPGIGAAWAHGAENNDVIGILGPLGRPLREAEWYVMGCDETGLPALSRILESLPPETSGVAFIEIGEAADRQDIVHPHGIDVRWIYRNAQDGELTEAIKAIDWPTDRTTFGWFASEGHAAAQVREHWRSYLGYGRDQTLAAAYWKKGQAGLMAG